MFGEMWWPMRLRRGVSYEEMRDFPLGESLPDSYR